VLDEQGNVVEANDMFCQMLGYSREEMLRLNVAAWDKQWPAAELTTKIRHFIDHPGMFETRHQTKDGSIREVEINGRGVTLENRRYLYASARDITERKRLEEALVKSETRFRSLLQDVQTVAVQGYGLDGTTQYWNQASEQLYGYSAQEAIGRNLLDLIIPPEMCGAVQQAIRQMAETGQPIPASEMSLMRKDGSRVSVYSCHTIVQIPGHEAELFCLDFDLTERKRMEAEKEKLETQNRQLHKSESLGRMAGAIAHHFNNKLAAVMMNLEMARNDLPPNTELAEALESARAAAMVSTLMLTYLGQTYGKRVSFELAEACRDHLPILRASLPLNVTLETNLPTSGLNIKADVNQIQQVLSNLLTNAEEAIGVGTGVIRLSVKTVAAADIPPSRRFPIDAQLPEKEYACLEVADTGGGITPQDIEKLCDPFYSTKFTGRGLGLPVVLGIVRAHQGVITVESRLGKGSVFRVFLPVSGEVVPKKPVPVTQTPKLAGSGTVLVVDDENSVRNAMSKAFKHLGFTVLAAVDGAEAVEIFQKHQTEIRLVLCDLTMPRMNGWETLAALRKLSPDLPVLLSSGYSEVQALAGQHTELPQAFLGKPYQFEELRDTVARVLEKAESDKKAIV
jgi:PAS domain S-box-containing protein